MTITYLVDGYYNAPTSSASRGTTPRSRPTGASPSRCSRPGTRRTRAAPSSTRSSARTPGCAHEPASARQAYANGRVNCAAWRQMSPGRALCRGVAGSLCVARGVNCRFRHGAWHWIRRHFGRRTATRASRESPLPRARSPVHYPDRHPGGFPGGRRGSRSWTPLPILDTGAENDTEASTPRQGRPHSPAQSATRGCTHHATTHRRDHDRRHCGLRRGHRPRRFRLGSRGPRRDFVGKINALRASQGAGQLQTHPVLTAKAAGLGRAHGGDRVPLPLQPHRRHQRSSWSKLGENVGRGPNVASLQAAFTASPRALREHGRQALRVGRHRRRVRRGPDVGRRGLHGRRRSRSTPSAPRSVTWTTPCAVPA